MIHIVTGDPRPIFRQIVDGFRVKIATGEIAEGTKLPSVRGLAMQLTINSNTVAKAYSELTSLGLVDARKGLGLFVAPRRQLLSDDERARRLDEALTALITDTIGLDYSSQEIIEKLHQKFTTLNQAGPAAAPNIKNTKDNEND